MSTGDSRVLLVEDDELMADLVRRLLEVAAPGVAVDHYRDVGSAELGFRPGQHVLLLCDWNLPGKPGIALIEQLRRHPQKPAIWMLSGRTDRASVISARSRGVDGFIAKPFQMERVVETLRLLLAPHVPKPGAGVDLLGWLAAQPDAALEPPLASQLGDGARAVGAADALPDLHELEARWAREPALVARLIAMSNSSLYNRDGRLLTTLTEALQRLGVRVSLNAATLLALRGGAHFDDPTLSVLADQQLELIERVATAARDRAIECGVDPARCETAALLHRLGELAVLHRINAYAQDHGPPSPQEIQAAVERFARPFADRIHQLLRYPAQLRRWIDAVRHLPDDALHREQYILRLAGGQVFGDLGAPEQDRLLRLAKG